MAATTMPFLEFFNFRVCTFFLGVVRLASHLCFAMSPNDAHAHFGIADMTNLLREVGIRLIKQINKGGSTRKRGSNEEDIEIKSSAWVFLLLTERSRRNNEPTATQGAGDIE